MDDDDDDAAARQAAAQRAAVTGVLADRAHSANSELAVLAEVLAVLPARSGSVSNSEQLRATSSHPERPEADAGGQARAAGPADRPAQQGLA
jgi:hypothetical protein